MVITKLKPEHVGKRISCMIQDIPIRDGKIQYEGNYYYICQDVISGNRCLDKLGYHFSWSVRDGSSEAMCDNEVTNIILLDPLPIHHVSESKPTSNKIQLINTNQYLKVNQND